MDRLNYRHRLLYWSNRSNSTSSSSILTQHRHKVIAEQFTHCAMAGLTQSLNDMKDASDEAQAKLSGQLEQYQVSEMPQ